MKKYGLNKVKDFNKEILTKEDYDTLKKLRNNDNIIIRKADKSNTFVILDKLDYQKKLNEMLSDENKFKRINKDPTDNIKKQINEIVD